MIWKRLKATFFKGRLEKDLDDELRFHLEMLAEENGQKGMAPEDALNAARRSFGGVEQAKESYRDVRGLPLLESLIQDLRFGTRILRRNPGFTAVAVLTLALGIGVCTGVFSVVYAVIMRPLNRQYRIDRHWRPGQTTWPDGGERRDSIGPNATSSLAIARRRRQNGARRPGLDKRGPGPSRSAESAPGRAICDPPR